MNQKFPVEFVKRIEKLIQKGEQADFFAMVTEPLPKVIRTTSRFSDTPDGWDLRPTAIPSGFFIDRAEQSERPLGKTLPHFTGQIYSQSLSSMLPVKVLDPQPGELVLDMCAAPGSKTTYLSQLMADQGLIVANEPSGTRSKKLVANLSRLGVSNTVLLQSDGAILDHFLPSNFDRVLLDAPCSSEGFGRRDAKFFAEQWSLSSIAEIAKLQRRLIVSAFRLLKVDGVMTYSTCTSAPEENEAVVQHLLETFPGVVEIETINEPEIPFASGIASWNDQDFDLEITEKSCRLYPHQRNEKWNSESFFVCKIRKVGPTPPIKQKPITAPSDHHFLSKNSQLEITTKLAKHFGLPKDWAKGKVMFEKSGTVYLTTKPAVSFCNHYLWRRAGLPILDKSGFVTTDFALQFGSQAHKNVFKIDEKQCQRWLAGFDLSLSGDAKDMVLVKHQDFVLGWGKVVKDKCKNKLPRELTFTY